VKSILAFLVGALLAIPQVAAAQPFSVVVSTTYTDGRGLVVLNPTFSAMDVSWFVQRPGGRTIYSADAAVGVLVWSQPPNTITAHATWVINFDPTTNTVNLSPGQTHITNWYPLANQQASQQCHVYETGYCQCYNNQRWNYCGGELPGYIGLQTALAQVASAVATVALRSAGYNVTRN